MTQHLRQHRQRSNGRIIGGIVLASLLLAFVVVAVAWVSAHYFATRESSQAQKDDVPQGALVFDYTVTTANGHTRVNGTTDLPNGVILVGTLDKLGRGTLEVKESLVINRLFTLEFGPELYMKYLLHEPQNALRPGMYRLTIEFDPSRQSPFVRGSLLQLPLLKASRSPGNDAGEIDTAIIRLAKTFTTGTTREQQETQDWELQASETIQHHLRDALGKLATCWSHLHQRYQQERQRGNFPKDDLRASEWQTWATQWLQDLKGYGEEARLHEAVSPVTPHFTAQSTLLTMHNQLAVMPAFYFEVLINERSFSDPDLRRAEHMVQSALGDAMAELGQPDSMPSTAQVDRAPPTVIVTAPLVNVRKGPAMSHEPIKQLKKDDVLDFIAEQGEWFQVQLGGTQTGWVHRNVASKRSEGEGSANDTKLVEGKLSSLQTKAALRLEPINLSSTPLEFIPRPTSDEVRIYLELEPLLRDLQTGSAEERSMLEQRILQRMSDKHGITPQQIWNAYLKVQGWEIRP